MLGIVLHFVISLCVAAVYFIGARNTPFLVRHPVVSGLSFGVIIHLVMRYGVVPLSAIGTVSPYTVPNFLNSFIGHAMFVGLPVALIAARSANKAARNRN